MSMNMLLIRILFLICGVYDLTIGVAFLGFGPSIFEAAEVAAPNHWGYLQFAAALVGIFGLMFLAVAAFPAKNRNLVFYGILFKTSYVAVASYYWAAEGIPWIFKPFVFIDGLMLLLFIAAWRVLHTAKA